ncbi:MAG: hypothetical protein GY756_16070 [bacterium]|nr:hypothetical protein [bacterium]
MKVFTCNSCGQQNFIISEKCHKCNGTNIIKGSQLFCYTCGYTAFENEFEKNSEIHCPKCNTHLKVFTEDYASVFETARCIDCRIDLIETEIYTNCLSCKHEQKLEELNKKNLNNV